MSHLPVPSESPPTVVSEAIEAFAEGDAAFDSTYKYFRDYEYSTSNH